MGIQNTGQESEWAERSGSSSDTMAPVNKNVVCHLADSVGKHTFYWKYTAENVWECAIVRQFIN